MSLIVMILLTILSLPQLSLSNDQLSRKAGFVVKKLEPLSRGRGQAHLKDIDSMLKADHIYRHEVVSTWAHEATHGINSRARLLYQKQYKTTINALYMLDGYVAILGEPPLTMEQVAAAVPLELRGQHTYTLYMVDQRRYWNNEPLYILDELTAYTNGAVVGIEYGESVYSDEWFALDMLGYALTMCKLLEADDSYNSRPLYAFVNHYCVWHSTYIKPQLIGRNQYYKKYTEQYELLRKYYGNFIYRRFGPKTYAGMFRKERIPLLRKILMLPFGEVSRDVE